jgi:ABC-2 type transport system permease protein
MKYRYPMYITLIILINIAANTLFFRLDLTENKSYSLSNSSKEIVANLEEPLTIKVFLSQNLPVPYNNLERDIRDILGEYKLRANKHFNYTIDIISKEGENNANPETYGIYPVNIQNIESDEVKVVSAYIGMTLIHGDLSEAIPAIQYNQNLEFLISNSLRRITEKTTALLSLEENLRAKFYLSPVLTTVSKDLKDYYKELEKLIANINKEYFNRITLELVEPLEGELTALGNKYNLNLVNIQNGGSSQSAIAGIVIEGNNDFIKEELIARDIFGRTVIKGIEDIEGSLRSGIDRLVGTGTRVGYLTSNGTIPMNQSSEVSVNALSQIISENYSLQQVNLGNGYISSDINTLIIAKPTIKFSERELFILDQYLLKGNSLLVVLDQFEPDYAMAQYGQENYNKIDHGLLELLAHHGITVESNMVMDEKSFKQTQRDSRGGIVETQIYFAPMLAKQTLSSHKTLNGINELMTFKASEVKPTYPENTETISLFTTSENGWRVDFDKVTMDPNRIYPSAEKKKYPLVP